MKLYHSKKFHSKIKHADHKNIFLVLNDDERKLLQQKYVELIKELKHNMPNDFNNYDLEMIDFIPKMFHYHPTRQDCTMLDPSITQLVKIDKMLNKVGIESFIDWINLHNEKNITYQQMKDEMDRKRKMKKLFDYKQSIHEKTKDLLEY